MSAIFLQKLEKYLVDNKILNKAGVSIVEIEKLESESNFIFPKAYTEFLKLAGKYLRPININGLSSVFENLENDNQRARANLKNYGLEHLIPKDFWVVAEMDGSVYIHYIFFDEGDNPAVYGLDMEGYTESGEPTGFFGKSANSFSEYIEKFINDYDPKLDK